MNKKLDVCLVWKGVIDEDLGNGRFKATLFNVVENSTKDFGEFSYPELEDEIEEGKVFWWVVTDKGESLQFMQNNIGEEEQAEDLRKAKEKAKEWNRLFQGYCG